MKQKKVFVIIRILYYILLAEREEETSLLSHMTKLLQETQSRKRQRWPEKCGLNFLQDILVYPMY